MNKNLGKTLIAASMLVSGMAVAMPITINSNHVGAYAMDSGVFASDSFTGTSVPSSATISAVSGSSHNVNTINYMGDASGVSLSVGMNHSIDNTDAGYDFTMTYDNVMMFTANEDTSFELSGYYDFLGTGTSSSLVVSLADMTSGSLLYMSSSVSLNDDITHMLADDAMYSLAGNLTAGHQYQFFFLSSIGDSASLSGNANGQITLNIGTTAQLTSGGSAALVPEPGILAILSLGLIMLGVHSRRQ